MIKKRLHQIISIGLVLFLLYGCDAVRKTAAITRPTPTNQATQTAAIQKTPTQIIQPTLTITPTQTVPANVEPSGRLIVKVDRDIYELVINPITKNVEQTLLVSYALEATISHDDKSYLLYQSYESHKDTSVRLRDLRTGEIQTVIKDPESVSCLSWSTISTKFSAIASGSFDIYDVSGSITHIPYEPPSALYKTKYGPGPATGPATREYGSFTCGVWISPQLLIFQRVATMPQILSEAQSTTTLIVLGDTITLLDSPEQWNVVDVCADKNLAIISNKYGLMYLVHAFQDFNSMDLVALDGEFFGLAPSAREKGRIGFLSGNDCQIYLQNPHLGIGEGKIYIIDPDNLKNCQEYSAEARMYISLWEGIWVGNPQNGLIAILESSGHSRDGQYVSILNLYTGSINQLTKIEGDEVHILNWLP